MKGRGRKKTLFIRIPGDRESMEKFIELAMNSVQTHYAQYRVREDGVEIKLSGDPISIKRTMSFLRKTQSDYYALLGSSSKDKRMTIINKFLVSKTLGVPVGLEPLKTLLSTMNIPFEYNGEDLIVNLYIDDLREIAVSLYNNISEAKRIAQKSAAMVIGIVKTASNMQVIEIVNAGLEKNVFRKEDEKILLRVEKKKALKKLLQGENE